MAFPRDSAFGYRSWRPKFDPYLLPHERKRREAKESSSDQALEAKG